MIVVCLHTVILFIIWMDCTCPLDKGNVHTCFITFGFKKKKKPHPNFAHETFFKSGNSVRTFCWYKTPSYDISFPC